MLPLNILVASVTPTGIGPSDVIEPAAIKAGDVLETEPTLAAAFDRYERERRTEVLRLQSAARNSTEWFEQIERYLAGHFASYGRELPPPGLYDRILQHVERPLLMAALAATRGNQIRAAALLGLNRNTLRKKIRDLDIQVFRTPAV